jgi:hypothetical protein
MLNLRNIEINLINTKYIKNQNIDPKSILNRTNIKYKRIIIIFNKLIIKNIY